MWNWRSCNNPHRPNVTFQEGCSEFERKPEPDYEWILDHITPPKKLDSPFDPNHVGYYKGERKGKGKGEKGILHRLIKKKRRKLKKIQPKQNAPIKHGTGMIKKPAKPRVAKAPSKTISKQQIEETMRQVNELLVSKEKEQKTKVRKPLTEVCLELFEHESCSWCKNFYTKPSICPYGRKLMDRCLYFQSIGDDERRMLLGDKYWRTVIIDVMYIKLHPSSAIKCRNCQALNADPSITHRWTCLSCGNKL